MKTPINKLNKRLLPGWEINLISLLLIAFLATTTVLYYKTERERIHCNDTIHIYPNPGSGKKKK